MRWIVSRYNHAMEIMKEYPEDVFLVYDRSETPLEGSIVTPNIGSDLYDKFTFIIDNYDDLPEVAIYTKANLWKYITKEEFELVKDNTTFTPLLTQHHKEVTCDKYMPNPGVPFSYYKDGMYYELNYPSYLRTHKTKDPYYSFLDTYREYPLVKLLGLDMLEYIPFAPGSNYILPKENILKHPKEFYETLRSYLEWDRYPAEAMIIERGLFTIWG